MKRILLFIGMIGIMAGADATVRDGAALSRATTSPGAATAVTTRQSGAVTRNGMAGRTDGAAATSLSRARTIGTRTGATVTPRTAASTTKTRTAGTTPARAATSRARTATVPTNARATGTTVSRAATSQRAGANKSRAATMNAAASRTFGTGYNACRDAYFTCMDQFCATQNDAYRRCVCSSRLADVQQRERALGQTANQILDFKSLNIEVIPKTAAEVKAMLSASAGESAVANARDKSAAAQQLAGISDVLAGTKSKSLSTAGTLDIAGDINAIWATTDLTSGVNIANLTGDALYNAVHSQCAEMVTDSCDSTSTLNMVVAAYGMYIENDCTTLLNALDKKKVQADGTIRETEREMNLARLENYNAHNSSSINDCIALVRADITGDMACGTDYVHCLDVTGRYLNRDTGEPIYTADFYQLETQVSLSGDVLNNQTNRMIVAALNDKRAFAQNSLETCRDLADDVWDEFMRQALTEIYQGQQNRIRQVKNECLDVVNTCYDQQANSLKDFSNVKEQLLLGSRLELSEEMCKQKLDACSNLYGGGPNGLRELLIAMYNITSQKIAKECKTALTDFARDMCAVPSNDSLHAHPYACRVYAPGEMIYATIDACVRSTRDSNTSSGDAAGGSGGTSGGGTGGDTSGYVCPAFKRYKKCNSGYQKVDENGNRIDNNDENTLGLCIKCDDDDCTPPTDAAAALCGDFIGSLYQKLVRYALQVCVRPSQSTNPIPTDILADVNSVMDTIRVSMARELAAECERLGGYWVDAQWQSGDNLDRHTITQHELFTTFYNETGANKKWGYCANPSSVNRAGTTTGGAGD